MPRLVAILGRMRARDVGPDYTYYGIASPWLQASAAVSLYVALVCDESVCTWEIGCSVGPTGRTISCYWSSRCGLLQYIPAPEEPCGALRA